MKKEVKVINPGFKYKDTRKPNKILVGKEPWKGHNVNGITGMSDSGWSMTGSGIVKQQSTLRPTRNKFKVYHG